MARIISGISVILGQMILTASALLYVGHLIEQSLDQVAPVGFGAFAMVGAVSGLCFTMAQVVSEQEVKDRIIYSGETFLHSALLILQSIALKYASESIMTAQFKKSYPITDLIFSVCIFVMLSVIAVLATYFLLYAFESINTLLWERFRSRKKDLKEMVGGNQ